jgi:hypothetical protein
LSLNACPSTLLTLIIYWSGIQPGISVPSGARADILGRERKHVTRYE